jgi:hypothetical protein
MRASVLPTLLASLLLPVCLPACVVHDGGPPSQGEVLTRTDCPALGGDYLDVMSWEVTDDGYLDVTVGYGGGCADHDIWACWDGQAAPSIPPQVQIVLGHDAHGDSCDAYITETRRFDLAAVTATTGVDVVVSSVIGP